MCTCTQINKIIIVCCVQTLQFGLKQSRSEPLGEIVVHDLGTVKLVSLLGKRRESPTKSQWRILRTQLAGLQDWITTTIRVGRIALSPTLKGRTCGRSLMEMKLKHSEKGGSRLGRRCTCSRQPLKMSCSSELRMMTHQRWHGTPLHHCSQKQMMLGSSTWKMSWCPPPKETKA